MKDGVQIISFNGPRPKRIKKKRLRKKMLKRIRAIYFKGMAPDAWFHSLMEPGALMPVHKTASFAKSEE